MRMRLLCAMMFLLLSIPAGAETITIRSGDHAGFSRLVFPFTDPVGWKLGRVGNDYEIRFPKKDLTFDISKVFRKIDQRRILGLETVTDQNHTGIIIKIGCDCHADAFEFRPGLVVVDIKDGPPEKNAVFEQAFAGDEMAHPNVPHESELETRKKATPDQPVSGQSGEISPKPSDPASLRFRTADEKPAERISLPLLMAPERKVPQSLLPHSKPPEISRMGADFIAIIGKAATDGLLTPNVRIPKPRTADEHGAPSAEKNQVAADEQTPDSAEKTPERRLPIRVRSSIDEVAPTRKEHQLQLKANGATCLPGSIFDLPSWGDPSDPYGAVVRARSELAGEFDLIAPEDISTLARAYLYVGFGAEAKTVISAFDQKPQNAAILMAMSEIMDDGWAFERSALAEQISCETDGALWAALSLPEFPRGLKMNREAIKRAFSALPAHIRRHLGPVLVSRFHAWGDEEMAHVLERAVLRVADADDSRIVLMEADFSQGREAEKRTEGELVKILESNHVMSAEALLKLVQTKLENGEEISDELIEASAAMAFEREGSETGKALQGLYIISLASRGRFAAALQEWRRYSQNPDIAKKDADELLARLLDYVTKEGSDQEFLTFVYRTKEELLKAEADTGAYEAAAKKLIDLGFPKIGSKLLEMLDDDAGHEILMARAAIEMNQPEVALSLLDDKEGSTAFALKAQAAEKLSRFALAAKLYEDSGNQSAFQNMLMKMNEWKRLEAISSEPWKSIAELAMENMHKTSREGAITPDGNSNLTAYRELLNSSKGTRNVIETLLKTYSAQTL